MGYLTIDAEDRIVEANSTAASLLGLEHAELLRGRTFSSFVQGDRLHNWDIHREHIAECAAGYGFDLPLNRPDEKPLTVRVECRPHPVTPRYLIALTDITGRVEAEVALKKSEQDLVACNLQLEQLADDRSIALYESEAQFRSTINNILVGVVVHAADSSVLFSNPQASFLLGLSREQLQGKQAIHPGWQCLHEDGSVMVVAEYPVNRVIATGEKSVNKGIGIRQPGSLDVRWLTGSAMPVFNKDNVLVRIVVNFVEVTERKRLQQALERRVLALTRPLDQPEGIAFDDLFSLSDIQRMQDEFASATGVASIIVAPDGTLITIPSNFTGLCEDIFGTTEEECVHCFGSSALIRRPHPEGPVIRQCQSSGMWDAGASIEIGGLHIATWLIGQVLDAPRTAEQVRAYACEIEVDETTVAEAFSRVPVMTREHFADIAQALFTLANQLSASAYQNVQQARFIEEQKRAEQALQESEEKYRKLFESESDAIVIFDGQTRKFIDVNNAALQLYGYTRDEFLQLTHDAITADPAAAEAILPAVLEGHYNQTILSKHRKKDGVVFPTEITGFSYYLQGRAVICGVIRDRTERTAYENALEKNREELRSLASKLSMTEQHERERIGRALHDGLSQLLGSALIRLNVLKTSALPEAMSESLTTINRIVEEALDETRSLTFELSCPMLKELGLVAALEDLCSCMTCEHAIRFDFKSKEKILPIAMDRKIELFRSTRELLINVMKHSGASRASVHIERRDNCVRITVEDNGVGFDAETAGRGFSPTGGFGLFNIREYIRYAGGSLQIESIPGSGTVVVISMPLEVQHA